MRREPVLLACALILSGCDPVGPPAAPATITAVATGLEHTCVLAAPGQAWCWGAGVDGQLGNGGVAGSLIPTPVDGGLVFDRIVAGDRHTCALTAAGEGWCWGDNRQGQMGGAADAMSPVPRPVQGGVRFTMITAGAEHTCGLSAEGLVYCWGEGSDGRLGDGAEADRSAPALVAALDSVEAVSAGGRHTCARRSDLALFCWGANDLGQLGIGTDGAPSLVPVRVGSESTWAGFSAGRGHSCAIAAPTLIVHCWGENAHGEIGNATGYVAGLPAERSPVPILLSVPFSNVSAGSSVTCGVRTNGEAMCWGRGTKGQLGHGRLSDALTPQLVRLEPGREFRPNQGPYSVIEVGGEHACALADGSRVLCWGSGDRGQLGNGQWLGLIPRPVRIPPL